MGIAIVIIIIIAALLTAKDNAAVKCKSCGWTGSNKKWNEYKGCPHCHSDLKK